MRRPALWRATAKRLLPATISLVVSATTLQAQATGTINGRVVDAENGQPIAAAQITISGTQLGRSTGDDGRFSLPNLTAGSKTLIVRRIGYQQQSRTVTLGANATITVDFSLAKSSVSLAGVVVTATGE